jgi:hypothetical protein
MQLSSFGQLHIEVTRTAADPQLMNVDIGAEHRTEAMHMVTSKDETIDQFCQRVRGMLRALWNARIREEEKSAEMAATPKTSTWDEQKATLKQGRK